MGADGIWSGDHCLVCPGIPLAMGLPCGSQAGAAKRFCGDS